MQFWPQQQCGQADCAGRHGNRRSALQQVPGSKTTRDSKTRVDSKKQLWLRERIRMWCIELIMKNGQLQKQSVTVKQGLVQQGFVSVGFFANLFLSLFVFFCLFLSLSVFFCLFLSFSGFCYLSCNFFLANVMRSTRTQHERSVMLNAWLNIAENSTLSTFVVLGFAWYRLLLLLLLSSSSSSLLLLPFLSLGICQPENLQGLCLFWSRSFWSRSCFSIVHLVRS